MKLQYAACTDVGRRRQHNEDAFDLAPDENLFVVADGLGGYAAGEVASQMAVESIAGFFRAMREDEDLTWPEASAPGLSFIENKFANAVYSANQRIHAAANDDHQLAGMSTTVVGLHFVGERYYVAHVGDSRCYRVRDGVLERITEDHSLLNELKKSMRMSPEEEAAFPLKNVILRALGQSPTCQVDVANDVAQSGDLFLLCTDGLNGELTDSDILGIVSDHDADLDAMSAELIRSACSAGGRDNVTVVAIRVP